MKEEGPHIFLSQCLHILCTQASKLDILTSSHIQGKSCVCLHIIPEIQRIINNIGDLVIKELQHWIQIQKQEQWNEHDCLCLSVIPPNITLSQHLAKNSTTTTTTQSVSQAQAQSVQQQVKISVVPSSSSSAATTTTTPAVIYDWMVLMMSQYIRDTCILFNPELYNQQLAAAAYSQTSTPFRIPITPTTSSTSISISKPNVNMKSTTVSSYSKLDISETESTAIASMLRVVIRFCIELESAGNELIDNVAIVPQTQIQIKRIETQINCYVNTLKAVVVHLIPSIHNSLCIYFSNCTSSSPIFENLSPQLILQMLCQRLEEKGKGLTKLISYK